MAAKRKAVRKVIAEVCRARLEWEQMMALDGVDGVRVCNLWRDYESFREWHDAHCVDGRVMKCRGSIFSPAECYFG